MTKEKIKKETRAERKEKDFILKILVVLGIMMFVGIFCQNLWSDQIVHKFKSPSFNGVGTSSHYLTIENQEFSRKLTIKEEIKASNEGQIYSQ